MIPFCTHCHLQERLWKRFAAKSIAFAAAAERRAKTLKPVPQPVPKCGDQLGKVKTMHSLFRDCLAMVDFQCSAAWCWFCYTADV